ncbi:hypothetical protein AB0F72_08530 [Actinoplanes sp. NPDC023936]|uniref:hypothetical protein n=1 Tax=Actinoplanes sp. NPDC023936 TaxID=3154910 RepID=UPI003411336C
MPATTDQVQAVIDGTVPCPRDTDGLPELIAAATDVQRPLLRGRVFEQYGPYAGDLVWRRAEAASYTYRKRTA